MNIFSRSVLCLLFISLTASFDKSLIYQNVILWLVLFASCLRNLCLPPNHEDILFSFISFIVLTFTFSSVIDLELTFVYGVR